MTEKRVEVAPAMHDANDKRIAIFNAVDNHILSNSHSSVFGTEILFAGTSDKGSCQLRGADL